MTQPTDVGAVHLQKYSILSDAAYMRLDLLAFVNL